MAAVRYLVVSDLHLTDIEDHEDGWRPYKATRYVFDREFADLLDHALRTCPTDAEPVLLLNGDIIDFDLVTAVPDDPPWPVSPNERLRCLDPTPEKSAWKMDRVLRDHPGWIDALAGWILRGGRIVWVLGNHDRELHFEPVRDVFTRAVNAAAAARDGVVATGAIRFEPWFYLDPGRLFAEHGNQYDYYSSFKHVLCPVVESGDGAELALPMGNLSGRYLLPAMGYFNPHATDFILNLFAYLTHWLRYYAFTRRSLVMSWFIGSILVMARLLRVKGLQLRPPACYSEKMDEQAHRAGVARATVDALERLHIPPITTRFYRIVREFWIDRLAMLVVMTGGTVVLAFLPVPLWVS